MIIEKNKVVSIDYIMRNSRGAILENTANGARTNYLHGADGIHSYLQSQLEGLQAGDRKIVLLPNEVSNTGDDFSFEVLIHDVRNAMKEELQLGYPVMGECTADCDCYQVTD